MLKPTDRYKVHVKHFKACNNACMCQWGMLPILNVVWVTASTEVQRVLLAEKLQELLGDGYTEFAMSGSTHNRVLLDQLIE